MGHKLTKEQREQYFGIADFFTRFKSEEDCKKHLLELKFPSGFCCAGCKNKSFYCLHGSDFKRNRLIQCRNCRKQTSITAGTVFHGSKISLMKWFQAFYFISQTKKGISANLLSKQIKVAYSTALLMLYKIRREMEENAIQYQIGGPNMIVEADEIEIGGKGSPKQSVLVLLEKDKKNQIGRVRFSPINDKQILTIEMNLIPQIAPGTELHVDGKKGYSRIKNRNFKTVDHIVQVTHEEENNSHEFLKDLNMIVGNLKTWYRGIHHQFAAKNAAYYLNEFAYRFNRRRSEVNIFDGLLKRSIVRSKRLSMKSFREEAQYLPLAA